MSSTIFFAQNGGLNPSSSNYVAVKEALIGAFENPTDPDDNIRRFMNSNLNPDHLLESLRKMDCAIQESEFNEKAKFGLLRNSLTILPNISQFVIICGAKKYKHLSKLVKAFYSDRRMFPKGLDPEQDS